MNWIQAQGLLECRNCATELLLAGIDVVRLRGGMTRDRGQQVSDVWVCLAKIQRSVGKGMEFRGNRCLGHRHGLACRPGVDQGSQREDDRTSATVPGLPPLSLQSRLTYSESLNLAAWNWT